MAKRVLRAPQRKNAASASPRADVRAAEVMAASAESQLDLLIDLVRNDTSLAEHLRDSARINSMLARWGDFQSTLNDNAPAGPAALRAELEAMRGQPTIPDAVVGALLDGVNPIRAWREYRGLTQAQLAEKAPIDPAYLSQAENGKEISDKMLRRLAAALDAPLSSLRDDD